MPKPIGKASLIRFAKVLPCVRSIRLTVGCPDFLVIDFDNISLFPKLRAAIQNSNVTNIEVVPAGGFEFFFCVLSDIYTLFHKNVPV
jgi:hypothetical protein